MALVVNLSLILFGSEITPSKKNKQCGKNRKLKETINDEGKQHTTKRDKVTLRSSCNWEFRSSGTWRCVAGPCGSRQFQGMQCFLLRSENSKKNHSSTFLRNGGNHSPNDTVLIAETPCGQLSCRGTENNINHWVQAFLHAHTDSQ